MDGQRKRRSSSGDAVAAIGIVDRVVAAERASGEPFFTNVPPDSATPYSDATNANSISTSPSRKNTDRIKRPLNAFMVFAHSMRVKVAACYDHDRLNHAIVNKRLGELWQTYTLLEKRPFMNEANRLKQLHAKEYPDYRYRPRRRPHKSESDGSSSSLPSAATIAAVKKTTSVSINSLRRRVEPLPTFLSNGLLNGNPYTSETLLMPDDFKEPVDGVGDLEDGKNRKQSLKRKLDADVNQRSFAGSTKQVGAAMGVQSISILAKTRDSDSGSGSDAEFLGHLIVSDSLTDSELTD